MAAVAVPFLPGPATFGVMALLVAIGCPFVFCCWPPFPEWVPDDDPPS